MFEDLQAVPPDAILGLIAEQKADPRADKIDLGVGVYFDAQGRTPVLDSVKAAERLVWEAQDSKAYLGTAGAADFNARMQSLTFGPAEQGERCVTIQTPGGSGGLRVAAGLLTRARPGSTVWVPEPTWANHIPLLASAGVELKPYPYYDTTRHSIDLDAMLATLGAAPKGDLVLLHACCHNPSGMDPDAAGWQAIADVIVDRELVPFIDMAYQGFATDLDTDALAIRLLAERVPEMLVTNSCSKNFGLYRDRAGSLSVLCGDPATRDIVSSQLNNIVRTVYSVPPDHGAAIVSTILGDAGLRASWQGEVDAMRERLQGMRRLLADALRQQAPARDFSHLERANGMFCFLGISAQQVERLKTEHAIYLVGSSRINVAGITPQNVERLAAAIAATL